MNKNEMRNLAMDKMGLGYSQATNAVIRQIALDELGLSWDDAVQYAMERTYNQMSHSQAMSEINKQTQTREKQNEQ